MQFSCESCKAQLQIADEKVRGKRLIVRCKRCGAKIGISDPALGAAKPVAPKPATPSAPAAASPSVRIAVSSSAAAAKPEKKPLRRDSDTESTRAMDSDLLEQALQASKADDPSIAPNRAAAKPGSAAKPAPASADDLADWFAMLHGKQTGPMTRAELTTKIDLGEVGPRTYLWKDGMDAWQRAKDLPELAALFPQLPSAPPLPPPVASRPAQGLREFSAADFAPPALASLPPVEVAEQPRVAKPPVRTPAPGKVAPAASAKGEEDRTEFDLLSSGERVHQEGVSKELFSSEGNTPKGAADLAGWAAAELQKKVPSRPPAKPASLMFESAAPRPGRGPFAVVVIALIAVAAVLLWFEFGSASASGPKTDEGKDGSVAAPETPPETPPEKPPEKPAAKPAEKPPEPAPIGLTADQVRKKLDENKASLQTCIDEALRRDPNLRVGKIHIATNIAPSGQVTSAKIDKNTVEQSALGACLRKATKKIAFPPFGGDAFDVDIPIVVTAGE
jgi:predicted Zn finger-like uncharacterized protein